jgi:hypothetical protein
LEILAAVRRVHCGRGVRLGAGGVLKKMDDQEISAAIVKLLALRPLADVSHLEVMRTIALLMIVQELRRQNGPGA